MDNLNLFIPQQNTRKVVSRRNDKIATQIRECFSMAISRGDFPVVKDKDGNFISSIPSPITITYVDVSPDLRNVKVYFMPLCGNNKNETLEFLTLQTHFFKNTIAKKMRMRFIPEVMFKIDDSIEYSDHIEKILRKL